MSDDIKDGLLGALAVVLFIAMLALIFIKPESAIALSLFAIAIFKGMERP